MKTINLGLERRAADLRKEDRNGILSIFRYLKNTMNLAMVFSRDYTAKPETYADSDFA